MRIGVFGLEADRFGKCGGGLFGTPEGAEHRAQADLYIEKIGVEAHCSLQFRKGLFRLTLFSQQLAKGSVGGREARTYADGLAQLRDGLGAVASLSRTTARLKRAT